jgi:hypothetical protein
MSGVNVQKAADGIKLKVEIDDDNQNRIIFGVLQFV